METQTRIEQIERAIFELVKSKDIKSLSIHKELEKWAYYYQITGHYKGKYFSFTLKKLFSDSEDSLDVPDVTDCKEEITELITKLLQDAE